MNSNAGCCTISSIVRYLKYTSRFKKFSLAKHHKGDNRHHAPFHQPADCRSCLPHSSARLHQSLTL